MHVKLKTPNTDSVIPPDLPSPLTLLLLPPKGHHCPYGADGLLSHRAGFGVRSKLFHSHGCPNLQKHHSSELNSIHSGIELYGVLY